MPHSPRLTASAASLSFFGGLTSPQARKAGARRPAEGAWVEVLTAEHRGVQALFDKLLETPDGQSARREALLAKLVRALTRHMVGEEYVIYPALMESAGREALKRLFDDHAEIKRFVYDLRRIPSAEPRWRVVARQFRAHLDAHFEVEESRVFPSFHDALSPEENSQLARMLGLQGAKLS